MCSHACEITLDHWREATCAYSADTVSVSIAGTTLAPTAANVSSRIRRFCICRDSRHSGTVAASAQRRLARSANLPSFGVNSRYRSW